MATKKHKIHKFTVISNPDKTTHSHWGDKHHPTNDLWNIPSPYSMIITGSPNSGKSLLIKNLLVAMNPVPDNIFIMHAETFDMTKKILDDDFISKVPQIPEYKGVKATYLKSFAPLSYWDQFHDGKGNYKKNVLIIDDVNLRSWALCSGWKKNIIDKYYSFLRTHRNLTIITSFQSMHNQGLPVNYRYANVYVLYPIRDLFVVSTLARNVGMNCQQLKSLMSKAKSRHDYIVIDDTPGSPVRLRMNMDQPIKMEECNYQLEYTD